MNRYLAFVTAAAFCCAPSIAQVQTAENSAAKTEKPKNYDPDRKICEKIVIPGSKADVRRVCATQAEWADMRRRDREWIESVQRNTKNGNQ